MDNGLTFPYREKLVPGDEEGFIQPAIGSAGANIQGERDGENVSSQGVSPKSYGFEVEQVKLPRKALCTINLSCLYPKPTQVGW